MSTLITILVAIFCSSIVLWNVGSYIYKRIKHIPTGECSYCAKGKSKILKEYKKYLKNNKL